MYQMSGMIAQSIAAQHRQERMEREASERMIREARRVRREEREASGVSGGKTAGFPGTVTAQRGWRSVAALLGMPVPTTK